jgi:hypothetical protein
MFRIPEYTRERIFFCKLGTCFYFLFCEVRYGKFLRHQKKRMSMTATEYTECGVPFQSSELGPLPPHPQGKLLLPTLGPRGETYSLAREGLGTQIRRRDRHSGTLCTLLKNAEAESYATLAWSK